MKKLVLIILTLLCCSAYAQLPKGLSVKATGVNIGQYYYTVNMKKSAEAVAFYGSGLTLRMEKVSGFKDVKGKVILKVLLRIKDKAGKTLLENDDVFKAENENGGLDAELVAASLDLQITVASPMKLKEIYIAEFVVQDKNSNANVKGSFSFSSKLLPFSTYQEKGISSDGPVFITMPGNKTVTSGTLANPKELYALFYNVKGFTAVKGKVFIDASVSVKDSQGRVILDFRDLFNKENAEGGIDEAIAKERLMLNFSFNENVTKGEEYTCVFTFSDKKKKNNYLSSTITVVWNK